MTFENKFRQSGLNPSSQPKLILGKYTFLVYLQSSENPFLKQR